LFPSGNEELPQTRWWTGSEVQMKFVSRVPRGTFLRFVEQVRFEIQAPAEN